METAGQVLTYNGSVISTLYSASNGGMTSSNYYRWGSSRLPYFQVKIDEYDLEASFESSSYNTKFNLPKVGSSTELNNYVYKTMLPELLIQLYEQGYSADEDNFEILGFDNLTLHTPRFSDENCIMYLYLQADVIHAGIKHRLFGPLLALRRAGQPVQRAGLSARGFICADTFKIGQLL